MKRSEAAVIWVEEVIGALQPLLNIQHWKIKVKYRPKLKENWAQCEFFHEKHEVRIAFGPDFVGCSRRRRERFLLHELIHIQHEDAMESARRAVCEQEGGRLAWSLVWLQEEKAVDDMAWTLHKLIYS